MTTEERLQQLERQLRRLRSWGAVLTAVLGLALIASLVTRSVKAGRSEARSLVETDARGDIVARSITLQDSEGRARGALELTPTGDVQLVLRDESGATRLTAGLEHGTAHLSLADATGAQWARFAGYAGGGTTLKLRNEKTDSELYLAALEGGTTRLAFGQDEHAVIDLSGGTSPSITLNTTSGEAGIKLTVLDGGSSSVAVHARDGGGGVEIRAMNGDASHVSVTDAQGQVLWEVPP